MKSTVAPLGQRVAVSPDGTANDIANLPSSSVRRILSEGGTAGVLAMKKSLRRFVAGVGNFTKTTNGGVNAEALAGRTWNKMAPLLILCVSLLLSPAGCEEEPKGRTIRLSAAPQGEVRQQSGPQVPPLQIAVAPGFSPREGFELYRPLLHYVSRQLGRPVDFLHRRTCAEINDLIRHGHADAAFVCDYAFVEGERDFGMEILVVAMVMGDQTYRSYIIVPRESGARNLFDLEGKRFAFSDPLSGSGWLFPAQLLCEIGERPESFFQQHVFTYSHDSTVRAVAQQFVDGGAVHSMVYEFMLRKDPTYREKIKVIQESSPWGNPPFVVHPRIDPALRDQLRRVFLTMNESEEGRKALAPLMIDRFMPPIDVDYDPVRRMAAGPRGSADTALGPRTEDSSGDEESTESSVKVRAR